MNTLDLAAAWLNAKADEDAAKARRIEVEEALAVALPHKPEGSKTHTIGSYKVTLTGKTTYTLDREAWERVKPSVPVGLVPTKLVETIDPVGCKWLQENDPTTWALCAGAITSKPAKLGVRIERKEVKD